jgi:molecular chaperone GrpE (heat shock protein)
MEKNMTERHEKDETDHGPEAASSEGGVSASSGAEIPLEAPAPEASVPDHYGEFSCLMNEIHKQILMITEAQDRNDQYLTQMHKDFYQFMRIQDSMQEELEGYRAGLFRQLLDPVLSTIGRVYNDNIVNVEKIEDAKLRKNFSCLFDDLEQILTENGVDIHTSTPGESFSAKYCRVKNKIPTEEKGLHGKIIKSYNKGFHIGPRVLAAENVDVYVYDRKTEKEE